MKFKVGDKVRLTKAYDKWKDEDSNDGLRIGDEGVVIDTDAGDDLEYQVDFVDKTSYWYRECVLELVETTTTTVKGVERIVGAKVDNIVFQRLGDDVTIALVDDDLEELAKDVITIQRLREVMRLIDGDAA